MVLVGVVVKGACAVLACGLKALDILGAFCFCQGVAAMMWDVYFGVFARGRATAAQKGEPCDML